MLILLVLFVFWYIYGLVCSVDLFCDLIKSSDNPFHFLMCFLFSLIAPLTSIPQVLKLVKVWKTIK